MIVYALPEGRIARGPDRHRDPEVDGYILLYGERREIRGVRVCEVAERGREGLFGNAEGVRSLLRGGGVFWSQYRAILRGLSGVSFGIKGKLTSLPLLNSCRLV
jgi:hypothetical protein